MAVKEHLKDREPVNYAETILKTLLDFDGQIISRDYLLENVKNFAVPVGDQQLNAGVHNLSNFGLIKYIGDGSYKIDTKKLNTFADNYANGTQSMWYKKRAFVKPPKPKKHLNNREPANYAEAILKALLQHDDNMIKRDLLLAKVKSLGFDVGTDKFTSGLHNLSKQLLIVYLNNGLYKIDTKKLNTFADNYAKGTQSMWYKRHPAPKSTGKTVRPSDVIRAIFAAHDQFLSTGDIIELSKKYNKSIEFGPLNWFIYAKKDELIKSEKIRGVPKGYKAGPKFFANNSNLFKKISNILPEKADIIHERFARHNALPDPAKTTGRVKSINIVRAVFAAYSKPLALSDVKVIAKKHNHELTLASIGWLYREKKEIEKTDLKRGMAPLYRTVNDFFEDNALRIDKLIGILPAKKDEILSNFNKYVPELVKRYHYHNEDTITPIESKPKELAIETEPLMTDHPDQEEQETETIDAANVGASILAYVLRLKNQLKAKETNGQDSGTNEDKQKISRMAATIEGLKVERNQLNLELSKLQSILSTKEKHIDEIEQDLTAARNKLGLSSKPRERFKLSEVARMTNLIKSP